MKSALSAGGTKFVQGYLSFDKLSVLSGIIIDPAAFGALEPYEIF
jgi:hypothetical protein